MSRCLVVLFLFFAACSKEGDLSVSTKPLILVSIGPYQLFAERIAGSDFQVHTIVPQGSSAHTFEPTARQIAQLGRGKVWFRIGEPFEARMVSVMKVRNPGIAILDLREGVELLSDEGMACKHCMMDHQDRHIWMSPKLAIRQAEAMAQVLMETFPEKKDLFQKNLETLVKELTKLDGEIHTILRPVKAKVILVSHPAFGYFCRDYDCQQLSIEYEGKDPRPQHLQEIISQAVKKQAIMAVAIPQYNNKGAQLIAEKLHLPVQMIDPYSSDYFQMMRKLAQWVADPYHQDS